LLYQGDAGFVGATVPFIRAGLAADQPVLVALRQHKIDLLQDALGADADLVRFMDMAEIGRNPARLIPTWRALLDELAGTVPVRGIGEPIWSGRSMPELVECQRHESLLNLAIRADEPVWLLCPYDIGLLSQPVIDEVFRSHPYVSGHAETTSGRVRTDDAHSAAFLDSPLPPPPTGAARARVRGTNLGTVRARVRAFGHAAGLEVDRAADLELAVGELAANSILHGGGSGLLTLWTEGSQVVAQVEDKGRIADPLAGRRVPDSLASSGRGLWLVNQLCDLVQLRVFASGTTVRLHVERPPAP
jgi:anti-sigma regulatory factor (Ser/Thr protein kinase)